MALEAGAQAKTIPSSRMRACSRLGHLPVHGRHHLIGEFQQG